MAGKMQLVSKLAGQTAREVTQSAGNWKRYLDTASRLYKYPFDDQLLIYAQRPDAAACASLEVWNENMRRWVKAGAKGIALIHKSEGGRPYLTYVFDVADTRPVRGARMPQLWEMRKEHHAPVLAALERQYGKAGAGDFGERLMATGAGAAAAAYREHFRDMDDDVRDHLPESADGRSLEECFRDTVTASVQYALLSRCGLEPGDYLKEDALRGITAFSTPDALHHLGDAVSIIARGILLEIGRAIRKYDRDMGKGAPEKTEKEVEKPERRGYTIGKEQFNTLKRENRERSTQHGRTDLHEDGRLPDPGSDSGRGGRNGGGHARKIRDAAGALPKGAAPWDIHGDAPVGEAGAAPAADRRAGAGTDRPDRGGADGTKRRGRGAEGARPDGVAQGGEQLHGAGGGGGAAGDRLPVNRKETGVRAEGNENRQMTAGRMPAVSASGTEDPAYFQLSLFPAAEEQTARAAGRRRDMQQTKKAEPPPARRAAQIPGVPEDAVSHALTSGGNEAGSILRIIAFFQKSPGMEDAAAFLEKEYGTGGKGVSIDGKKYALWFGRGGIRVAPGRRADVPGSTFVTWEKAAALTMQLLRDGTYATQEMLDDAAGNERRELAGSLLGLRQNFSGEAEKRGFLPALSGLCTEPSADAEEKISGMLHDRERRGVLLGELAGLQAALRENPALLRFRLKATPEGIRRRLADLDIPREKFNAKEGFEPAKGSFVTEDETDWLLTRGSGVSNGKMRIYSYFMQGHDAKECAAFLRKEYGDGGFAYTGYNEWHDSRGITFTRSDDFSGHDGYGTVKMNWNEVQKRIRGLIADKKYLNAEEQAYTATYEKLVLARKLYAFFYYDPRDKQKREWDIHAAERDYMPVLDMPKYSATLYEDMVEGLALVSPEQERVYRIMEDAVESMGAFQRGEYSLFTPLAEEKLREGRMKREAAKKKKEGVIGTQAGKDAPAGELEAVARALAGKTRGKAREEPDGQLSFDFAALGADGPEAAAQELVAPVHEPEIVTRHFIVDRKSILFSIL